MLWTCPQCGAAVDASADRCWACNQPRPEPEPGPQTVSIPVPEPDREIATGRGSHRIGLGNGPSIQVPLALIPVLGEVRHPVLDLPQVRGNGRRRFSGLLVLRDQHRGCRGPVVRQCRRDSSGRRRIPSNHLPRRRSGGAKTRPRSAALFTVPGSAGAGFIADFQPGRM